MPAPKQDQEISTSDSKSEMPLGTLGKQLPLGNAFGPLGNGKQLPDMIGVLSG